MLVSSFTSAWDEVNKTGSSRGGFVPNSSMIYSKVNGTGVSI